MGNCVATLDLKMQGLNITGAGNIGFGNNTSIGGLDRSRIYNSDGNGTDLQVLAYQDLTLSGNRHIDVNAQALDLSDTPVSGNVNFQDGNITVAAGGTITVDNVIHRKRAYEENPTNNTTNQTVDWSAGNVQYGTRGATTNYTFTNDVNGQTLTMYVTNSTSSEITVNSLDCAIFSETIVREAHRPASIDQIASQLAEIGLAVSGHTKCDAEIVHFGN